MKIKKNKQLEVVFIGDLHLDKLANLFPDTHLILQMAEAEKAMEYAVTNGVPHVVFLGDVAHLPRLSEEARIALYRLLVKYDGRLTIHIILGNHDVAYEGFHSLQFFVEMYETGKFKSVHVYSKPTQVVLNKIPLNFLPFPAITPIPYKHTDKTINIGHLEVPGAIRDNGRKIAEDDGVVIKGEDVWFIGHLHTPQKLGSKFFCGTLYQTNFGESLPKSFMHVKLRNVDGVVEYRVKRVKNDPKFKFINLKIEKVSDLEKIDNNPYHLYKLFIKKGVSIKYDLMTRHKNLYKAPTTYSTESELIEYQAEEVEEISHNLTDRLGSELKKQGASKWQRKRGRQIVKNILKQKGMEQA